MAAALITKACALSPDAGLEAELARANDLRAELLATAERDVAAFYGVIDARRSGGDEREAWNVAGSCCAMPPRCSRRPTSSATTSPKRCRAALRGEPDAAALLAAGAERAALAARRDGRGGRLGRRQAASESGARTRCGRTCAEWPMPRRRNASTSTGSNCVPAPASSSLLACCTVIELRYGRSASIAS